MKVTLIAPPWLFKEEIEFISQNLGLGYIASSLQLQGHEVSIIDAVIEGLNVSTSLHTKYADVLKWGISDEDIINRIPSGTDFVGITAPFTDSRFVVNLLARKIKKVFPNIFLVMGGVYPSTLPEEALICSGVDVVVVGDGEITFSEIIKNPSNTKGKILYGKTACLSRLPTPSFVLRPMRRYVSWSPRGNRIDKTLSVVSSRGCPFSCNFCSIANVHGRNWRSFSPERVLSEIQTAINRFKVDHVEFEDDNLTLEKNRALKIFKGLKNLNVSWSAPNGVMIRTLDRELIFAMKESGAELVYLPVESGDEKILKLMNKAHYQTHLSKTIEVLGHCVDADIEASAFIIVGYPGEDKKSFEKTMKYCEKLRDAGISAITPLVATPYPNTHLYNTCRKNDWLVHPDMENVLIYQRYSEFLPEFVLIETPECSRMEAFERHQLMMETFPAIHNVRKDKS